MRWRTATAGLFVFEWRSAVQRGLVERVLAIAGLVGALGSVVPEGFQGAPGGAGAVGGALDAALAVAVTAPMLGAILTSAIVASETGTALDVAVFLSAVPRRARVASQTLVVLCLAAGVLVCATFGGVLGGTASSIRQGSGVLGSGNLLAPAAAALALLWWVLLFVAAAVQRLRLVNLSALFLSIPVFLLLVPALKEAAIGRLCLLFFPLSPWWGFVHGRGSDDYAYTTGDAAIPLLCLWAVVAVLLVRRSLQRRPY